MERTVGNMGYLFCMETDYDIIRLVNKNENVTNNTNNIECRPSITLQWCVLCVYQLRMCDSKCWLVPGVSKSDTHLILMVSMRATV